MKEISPLCEAVVVKFTCPECGEEVVSDALGVPSPDFAAETSSDSTNSEEYEVVCDHCDNCFQVTVYNAFYGGDVEVEGVDAFSVEEIFTEEDDDYENYVFDLTPEQITKVLDEIDSLSSATKGFLYRQLYAGTITSMEAFLSSTLMKEVLSSNETKRKFVENYLPYRDELIPYSSLFAKMEEVESKIRQTLRDLMYHNLGKIKPIYKAVLDIDLGDIRDIMKAVQIRHDIVHRSGKDTEGNLHNITKDDVIQLVEDVSSLMSRVSTSLIISGGVDALDDDDVELPFDD